MNCWSHGCSTAWRSWVWNEPNLSTDWWTFYVNVPLRSYCFLLLTRSCALSTPLSRHIFHGPSSSFTWRVQKCIPALATPCALVEGVFLMPVVCIYGECMLHTQPGRTFAGFTWTAISDHFTSWLLNNLCGKPENCRRTTTDQMCSLPAQFADLLVRCAHLHLLTSNWL